MKKSILLLSALACFSLVGCGSSNKDTSKEDSETGGNKPGTDESEKNPTVVEKTLTLNEGVAAFNKIIEALPQTETA